MAPTYSRGYPAPCPEDWTSSPPSSWHGAPGHSPPEPPLQRIEHALIRLEMGQHHNRDAGRQRVEALAHHFDTRITELRQDMGHRIDRVEDRLTAMEHRPASVPSAPVPPTIHTPDSGSTPPAPPSNPAPTPWWADMSPRERVISLLALAYIVTVWLRPDLAPALLQGVLGPLGGLAPK